MRYLIFILSTLISMTGAYAEIKVESFEPVKKSIHDISDTLGIKTFGGHFKTDKSFKRIRAGFAIFKDGDQKPVINVKGGFMSSFTPSNEGDVSLRFVDLDFLTIKDKPENSYYTEILCNKSGSTTTSKSHISKDTIDLDYNLISATITEGNEHISHPLYCLIISNGNELHVSANTLEELIRNHPQSDIVVIYLEFEY